MRYTLTIENREQEAEVLRLIRQIPGVSLEREYGLPTPEPEDDDEFNRLIDEAIEAAERGEVLTLEESIADFEAWKARFKTTA